jgi:hypothetical protein
LMPALAYIFKPKFIFSVTDKRIENIKNAELLATTASKVD